MTHTDPSDIEPSLMSPVPSHVIVLFGATGGVPASVMAPSAAQGRVNVTNRWCRPAHGRRKVPTWASGGQRVGRAARRAGSASGGHPLPPKGG